MRLLLAKAIQARDDGDSDEEQHALGPGTLLVIERGEAHEIRATGEQPLSTVNFYSPPAYADDGEPLPAGKAGDSGAART